MGISDTEQYLLVSTLHQISGENSTFFSKRIRQTSPLFLGGRVAASLCLLATVLLILAQKCRLLMWNLTQHVWGRSPVLLQYKKDKNKTDTYVFAFEDNAAFSSSL